MHSSSVTRTSGTRNPTRPNKGYARRGRRGAANQLVAPLGSWRPQTLYRELGLANTVTVQCGFREQVLLTGAGPTAARFTVNAAYDVDPILGSTNTTYFAELAALYNRCLVIAYEYHLIVTTADTAPITLYVINTNLDPGAVSTNYHQYAMNPNSTVRGIQPGCPPVVIRGRHTVASIVGRQIEQDTSFQSLTNTTPANVIFLGMGALGAIAAMTTGIGIELRVTLQVRFFERKLITA